MTTTLHHHHFAWVVALTACSSPGSLHVTSALSANEADVLDGIADRGADPAVVAIEAGGEIVCAGSLVAPDVVLTARHCVLSVVRSCSAVASASPTLRDPASLAIAVGDAPYSSAPRARGSALFVPLDPDICASDIALLLLDRAIDEIQPLTVRSTGVAEGDRVRTVGFGLRVGDAVGPEKLVVDHAAVIAPTDTEFRMLEGMCASGCGGPVIDEGTGQVVGVLSRGGLYGPDARADAGLTADVAMRADAFLPVVRQALGQGATVPAGRVGRLRGKKGPVDMGAYCDEGPDCAAGVCVTNGPRQYCSRTCAAHDRCPAHYRCQSGVQTNGSRALSGEGSICIST